MERKNKFGVIKIIPDVKKYLRVAAGYRNNDAKELVCLRSYLLEVKEKSPKVRHWATWR